MNQLDQKRGSTPDSAADLHVSCEELRSFVSSCLEKAGADRPSTEAVTRSLVGASLRGVDSHGVRLLPHYLKALAGGRINGSPRLNFARLSTGTGRLDADDGFGHLAGYRAIEAGIRLADENGIAAVTVINSSHFGAAGSYALAAAESGYLAIALCNSDKLVLPFDGVTPFHGTNPISFAAPVAGRRPYLIDMASSAIPLNRVLQYQAINRPLPRDVAVDKGGVMTTDAETAAALLPVGGADYGYKGAALAGLCEVLSSALTGMAFSHQLLSMAGPDYTTRRHLGHFFLVMKPEAFIEPHLYQEQIAVYLADLRAQPATPENRVMAAGDREWHEEANRLASGIPLDAAVAAEFAELAATFGLAELGHPYESPTGDAGPD
jgi:LDH2 family malate/lactate/ureidoglycolate dehydrogenase